MNPNLSNSIYQQKKAKPGLTVECGMLINNRPNSITGIQKAIEVKKAVKMAEKMAMHMPCMGY
jgi:outer membrane lipoprotein SlyB